MYSTHTEDIELKLLLETIFRKYGYDFLQYSEAHIKRRIHNRMALTGFQTISEIHNKVLEDKVFSAQLLSDLSITVTEMFRDADFYLMLREKVIPILRTYPFIKIWHAGCATGEEAYSMAILLKEADLLDRSTIYATDFNQQALDKAKEGIYSSKLIKEYTINYQRAGGKEIGRAHV